MVRRPIGSCVLIYLINAAESILSTDIPPLQVPMQHCMAEFRITGSINDLVGGTARGARTNVSCGMVWYRER